MATITRILLRSLMWWDDNMHFMMAENEIAQELRRWSCPGFVDA